jgi:hypothetical protein
MQSPDENGAIALELLEFRAIALANKTRSPDENRAIRLA